ncbi:MAG: DUF4091 domain-containing protein [Verrucomicrobiales bacterium]|nr:DUF4091 domain-containing protein [Verrucomicrobiales bacterium]
MNTRVFSLVVAMPLVAVSLPAQNLLPNPAFEEPALRASVNSEDRPLGWVLTGCAGQWRVAGTDHVLVVEGDGTGSGFWRSPDLPIAAGGLYALHFRARRLPGTSGGTAIAGTSRVNRDFPLDAEWRDYRFCFRQPANGAKDFVRLGQWQVQGEIEFDDVELLPVLASHRSSNSGLRLGEGETLRDGRYRFTLNLGWPGANNHQPLQRCSAGFNSDRWVFSAGSEVVYRFALPDLAQLDARVSVAINHHTAGSLHVEASNDGGSWTTLANFDGENPGGACETPDDLLPAKELYVRLSTPEAGASLQVNRLDYTARLSGAPEMRAEGRTDFLELMHCDPRVRLETFSVLNDRGQGVLQLFVSGTTAFTNQVEWLRELTGPTVRSAPSAYTVAPRKHFATCPTVRAGAPGDHELLFTIRAKPDQTLLRARTIAHLSHLRDPRAGHFLSKHPNLAVWWCESGWKVSRDGRPPETDEAVTPVRVSAARGEWEAAQVCVASYEAQDLTAAEASRFTRADGLASGIRVQINELAYVRVETPTDGTCVADFHPDPLPALNLPLKLAPHRNQPLWLTFHIPRATPAGDYTGKLTLHIVGKTDRQVIAIPLAVHVYDFELPRETHLRSALGLGTHEINRYHQLTRREDQIAVFEQYLRNFAEHRISPYSFFDYAPIQVSFEGEGADKRARVDFAEFDRWAERWLDGKRPLNPALSAGGDEADGGSPFNTFRLPLRGMGGGTFHSRHLGELEGFQEGTPEHARLFKDYLGQVEAHLREKGWLDEAFTYWFDEPDPKDYEFVVAGQDRIKAAAPGLQRMLTEQPEPALMGHVDIWCGLTPEWTPEEVRARRDAGEEVWWYICTGPKAPYVTEFIDHPGTELRLWPWQSWQYGVTGILVWATIYWTSPLAYPDSLQDPWEDPMSWVSGYGRPVGTRSPWGNGDGRFLYPPRRDPNTATEPCLDAPISSIRWENLRDGMEDYEYFWLLDQEIKRVAALPRDSLELVLAEARGLLVVPEEVSKDLTHFTTDPRTILAHRDKIARMIETLTKQR